MALAIAIVQKGVPGDEYYNEVDVTCDGAMPAGGYVLAASDFGFSSISGIEVMTPVTRGAASAAVGLVWSIEPTSTGGKLRPWKGNGAALLTEAAQGDVSSAVVVRLRGYGRG